MPYLPESQQENPIELRSEEIDEILGKAPNSIIRWGISIIFLLVLLVFAISYIVKYPETIKAEITLYSENMPATLVAKTSGKISKIFNNQFIDLKVNTVQRKNTISTFCY